MGYLMFGLIVKWPNHGIIIRTGIKCKKILWRMRDLACRCFFVKKTKTF